MTASRLPALGTVVAVIFGNDKRLGARFPLGAAWLKKCP
jgi:hypothetical protein